VLFERLPRSPAQPAHGSASPFVFLGSVDNAHATDIVREDCSAPAVLRSTDCFFVDAAVKRRCASPW
jgi:hypothetical protein